MGVATTTLLLAGSLGLSVYAATKKQPSMKLPPVQPPKVPPTVETDAKKRVKKTTGQSDTIITGDTSPTLGKKSILG
jgi:uroporphyrinogen-III decarboxylase